MAEMAAGTIISVEIEEIDVAAAIHVAAQTTAAQDVAVGATETRAAALDLSIDQSTVEVNLDVETQAAATRAAELLSAGGGDAGLQRRVAQRWLLQEFARCTSTYR